MAGDKDNHMQKILIVKTSSLGDVVHMLPAITDIAKRCSNAQIDWVVEEGFSEIPRWHSQINQVFPIALRRWRKSWTSQATKAEVKAFKQQLQQVQYDQVIDAQGLLKSALVSRWAKGLRYGYNWQSAREPLASWFYQQRFAVDRERHAITRNRLLTAQALGYSIVNLALDYGIEVLAPSPYENQRYIVALHGTSRVDKEWSLSAWQQLCQQMHKLEVKVFFPWGNEREKQRAEQLASEFSNVLVLPRSTLTELASILNDALGVIGMDTGLMHVAGALGKSGMALYPVTRPQLTGVLRSESVKGQLDSWEGEQTAKVAAVIEQLQHNLNLS